MSSPVFPSGSSLRHRVLVLPPSMRDAQLTQQLLQRAGFEVHVCDSARVLAEQLSAGAAAILVTEDVASAADADAIVRQIQNQPEWSEIPVLLLAQPHRGPSTPDAWSRLPGLTVLERPIRARTLVSALEAALRARRRQYELQAHLEAMRRLQQRLSTELRGMHRLHESGVRLSRAAPLEDLLREALECALELSGACWGAIVLHTDGEAAGEAEEPVALIGELPAARNEVSAAVHGLAARLGHLKHSSRLAVCGGTNGSPVLGEAALQSTLAGWGVRVLQCVPLGNALAATRGALCVFWRRNPEAVDTTNLLLELLGQQVSDMAERHHQEAQRRIAERRKDEFLATLAHELRNPLAPIRQGARVMRDGNGSAEQKRVAAAIIERQVSHMALLLDDLLDVSRISRGTLLLKREHVDLRELVELAVETAGPLIRARKHDLSVDLPDAALVLHADRLRISQVLSNLLNNAAKYTDPGGHLELQARQAGELVEIRVRDSGIGLAPGSVERIFEMFSQVTSALQRSEGGLGIGLALVKGLVAMHGGSVEARSEGLGKGSEFIVRLPLAAAPAARAHDAVDPAPCRRNGSAGRRIVVADDNVDAAESLAMLLRFEGHEVQIANDGQRALETFERVQPDVVVLDIGMPVLNGYEVARRIRADGGGVRPVQLIALTGWGQAEDRQRALEAGFDAHLTKPVDITRLLQVLN